MLVRADEVRLHAFEALREPANLAGRESVLPGVKTGRRLPTMAARRVLLPLALLAGCARTPPPVGFPEPGPPAWRGVTEVAFVPDPSVPPLRLPPDEEITRPAPTVIRAPIYPAGAMEAGCGDAVIGLRIIVDPNGAVAEVRDSPVVESTQGACGRRFREEAAATLRGWKFIPARWRRLEPGADVDGDSVPDYKKVIAEESIPSYLDVRIDFEVIEGEGRVRLKV
jgi:hypothetical protein